METDPKALVARGYDEIAEVYLKRFGTSVVRTQMLGELVRGLPSKARILDLGCGSGVPTASELVARGYDLTGVDLSARQIELARRNVPEARFLHSDITAVELPVASIHAVAAFYSITHIPREEHGKVLRRVSQWLTSEGRFVGSFGVAAGDWRGPWLGTTMYFSHQDIAETTRLVCDSGLQIERAETIKQDNEDISFFWIVARKP